MKIFDKNKFLDNINNIEVKKTINKFLDGLVSMEKSNRDIYISNFFTPLEFNFVSKILKKLDFDFDIIFSSDEYERKLVIIYNKKYDLIDYIEILRLENVVGIEHRHILGSILHLGINREKIGDIVKIDNFWYVYCLKPIGEFIFSNGLSFSKQKIKIDILNEIYIPENFKKFVNEKIVVSSLRLDCFVKELAKTSRELSKKFIKNGDVKLNYDECKDSDRKINLNDIISIRRIGKFKVDFVEGMTKKNKYVVNIKRYDI